MLGGERYTFKKKERLKHKLLIEKLFESGSYSISQYPIRLVTKSIETKEQNAPVKVLISVSKKHFKHAVKRNKIKRQIREAYRKNKNIILSTLENKEQHTQLVAFIWMGGNILETIEIENKIKKLLNRMTEKLFGNENNNILK